ncbi:hypothetical protein YASMINEVIRUS_1437 [Yasminevirus sp. GU-2018]|uniref:Uncharacterized protein n=1 Tax=Yasminevirus sp. GU-2018 TaxID=2420051 RepID=A0A5K0UB11_9VIRU|nr:hypothetical protein YASMINEVIRUS_1437 [Yasminevirus sp. GU-2018]
MTDQVVARILKHIEGRVEKIRQQSEKNKLTDQQKKDGCNKSECADGKDCTDCANSANSDNGSDSDDKQLSEAFKGDMLVLDRLLQDNSGLMNDAFRPFFKAYRDMLQIDPGVHFNHFPFNKNKLPNSLMDILDDILHLRINVIFQKLYDKPKELRKALKMLRPNDWVVMTFSRASSPLIHSALNAFQCRPDAMEILLKEVPTPFWFCPWNTDEFNLTPIQALTRYTWYFNPKAHVDDQKNVHRHIKSIILPKFQLLKLKELQYNFDPINMFNGVNWYACIGTRLNNEAIQEIINTQDLEEVVLKLE